VELVEQNQHAQQQLEQERQQLEQERQRSEKLAAKLKALGINPEDL
jgi:hypothetical protein